jgi:hypothetical protein
MSKMFLLLVSTLSSLSAAIVPDGVATSGGWTSAGSLKWPHPISGPNPILWVFAVNLGGSITSITCNGITLKFIDLIAAGFGQTLSAFALVAPPTGVCAIAVTATGAINLSAQAMSYSGASQTAQPTAIHGSGTAGNTGVFTLASTVLADGSWLAGTWSTYGLQARGNGATTVRKSSVAPNGNTALSAGDTGPASAGPTSLNVTAPGNGEGQFIQGIAAVFAPAIAVVPPTNIPPSTTGPGAGITPQLDNFSTSMTGAKTLSVGALCSAAAPCNVRTGSAVAQFVSSALITLSSGDGIARMFIDTSVSPPTLRVLTSGTLALGCNGMSCLVGSGNAFPADSIPLSSWTASGGSWDAAGGVEWRAYLSNVRIVGGTGISVTSVNGTLTITLAQ